MAPAAVLEKPLTPLDVLRTRRPLPGLSYKLAGGGYALEAPRVEKPTLDRARMTCTGIISTQTQDRSGDVVVTAGIRTGNHQRNPVVLFDHGQNGFRLPIGKAEDEGGSYTVILDETSDHAMATTHFSQKSQFANEVYQLIDEDILRGLSIGYLPLDAEFMPGTDPENPSLFLKAIELVEYSHLPLPDNADALRVRMEKGIGGRRLSLHLLRALEPHAAVRRVQVNGATMSTSTKVKTKGVADMVIDHLKNREREKGLDVDPDQDADPDDAGLDSAKKPDYVPMDDQGVATDDKPDPMNETEGEDGGAIVPGGAKAIQAMHDRLMEIAEEIEAQSKLQENPTVQDFLDKLAEQIHALSSEGADTHAEQYPELPPLEKMKAPGEEGEEEKKGEEDDEDEDKDVETKGIGGRELTPARKALRKRIAVLKVKRLQALKIKRMSKGMRGICTKAGNFLGELGELDDGGFKKNSHGSACLYHSKGLLDMLSQYEDKDKDDDEDDSRMKMKALRAENDRLAQMLTKSLDEKERLIKSWRRGRQGQ